MEYIKIKKIYKNYDNIIENNKYFLDPLKRYLNIFKYINLLKSIEEYKYKNIINFINKKFIRFQKLLYLEHSKTKYKRDVIHLEKDIDFDKFNVILTDFIDNDLTLCIFCLNLLQDYID